MPCFMATCLFLQFKRKLELKDCDQLLENLIWVRLNSKHLLFSKLFENQQDIEILQVVF